MKHHYEDAPEFEGAFTVAGYPSVAWRVIGWETEPIDDTEWTGIEERTGKLLCAMIGDDRRFAFELEELHPLGDDEYCGSCGQIGCTAWGSYDE